jgi:hypothetical protein
MSSSLQEELAVAATAVTRSSWGALAAGGWWAPVWPAPARPRRLTIARARSALLLAPLLLLVFSGYFFAPTDADYWWHVRTGQQIVETGALPRVDDYSYTMAGRAWVAHEWLTELLLYLVQQQLGYVGNVALFGLMGALTGLAVYATCRLRGLGEPASALMMLWAWAMGLGSANVRPQGLTALLIAVCALLLTRYQLLGQRRALWAIPPLMALWVNLHGGYLLGLLLVGLTIVGEAMARPLGRPAAPLRPLLVVAALATGATLLSPHGAEGLLYPFSYAGSGNGSMRFILEWQSPDFHQWEYLVFAGSLLLAAILGLGRRPLGPTECLWALTLALMGLQSVRHIALYAIVVTPLLAARLWAEVRDLGLPLATWRRPGLLAAASLVLALVVGRMIGAAAGQQALQLGREPGAATYPAGAVQYMRTHELTGNLFNSYQWGGYLVYQLYPDQRVFIDGRADVYGDEHLERYVQVARLRPGWRQVLEDHGVGTVLVEKDSTLAVVLADDAGWQEAYAGQVERLFVRR